MDPEEFSVLVGDIIYYVVIFANVSGEKQIVVVKGSEIYLKFLLQMAPRPERITVWTPTFTLPDFLEFARRHDVLKAVTNWEPFGLYQ